MSNTKKIDRRVRYTKKAIRDSFLALLDEKPIEKISVTEICKASDINRGTFYSHYSDPFDLRRSLANELVESMEERMRELGVSRLTTVQTFRLFKENRELFRIFAGRNADKDAMYEIISKQADNFFEENFKKIDTMSELEQSYLRNLIITSIGVTIKQWFDSDFAAEPEEVAAILDTYCSNGAFGFANKL